MKLLLVTWTLSTVIGGLVGWLVYSAFGPVIFAVYIGAALGSVQWAVARR